MSKYKDPLPGGISVSELTFIDSQNGWLWPSYVVGNPPQAGQPPEAFDDLGNPLATVESSPLIYATHDGGHTWAAATLELPRGPNNANRALLFTPPVMLDAAHGFLVLYVQDSRGAYTTYILRTGDGGNHWGALQGVPNGMAGSGVFLTESHWVAADGSFLKETTDGGKTWSSRRVLVDGMTLASGSPGNGLYYIAPATIWAQVREGHALIRSTDGGRTWEAVTPPTVH